MRKMIIWVAAGIVLILVAFFLAASSITPLRTTTPTPTPTPTPTATTPTTQIVFPTSTDQLIMGNQYTISWKGGPDPTQIFLIDTALEGQGESVSIVDKKYNVPNTGTYTYVVPNTLEEGAYKFQIGDAVSDTFQIVGSGVTTTSNYCQPTDLQARVSTEPAAGNIYGTLTLKNVSNKACQIVGNNYAVATYTAGNITLTHQGDPGPAILKLNPGAAATSKFHYPNGPQCSSKVVSQPIFFSYQISPQNTVVFTDAKGQKNQTVATCQSLTEETEVQVWSIQ